MSPRVTSLLERLARRKALLGGGVLALLVLAGVALSGMALSDVKKTDDAFVEHDEHARGPGARPRDRGDVGSTRR
jgi:hypothetical protein